MRQPFKKSEIAPKLQYPTPRRFRVGSASSAKYTNETSNTNEPRKQTNPKYEQTQKTRGFHYFVCRDAF